MHRHTVLITTSGIGSRLGNLTNYLNKSLIRVGNKFAICYIIDKYDLNNTQFIITLGYLGHLVKEFLDIAYKNNTFKYIYVDNYDKPGSSLVYSLLQAKDVCQCPFTFYCCDSIVLDNIDNTYCNDIKHNILFVSETTDASSYASVCIDNDKIVKIYSAGEMKNNLIYTGVSYIYNYAEYWESLETIYSQQPNNKQLSDINAINYLIKSKITFHIKQLSNWYDIGNLTSFKNTLKHFKCDYDILHKDNESLCFLDNKVIKYMADKNTVQNRVTRGNLLQPNTPQILDHSDHFFSMEYIDGTIMSKYYVYGQIYKLLNWSYQNLWTNKQKHHKFIDVCASFYKDKTLQRISQMDIEELNTINGIYIEPVTQLLGKLDWESLYTDTFYHFHGDFILDNIICTNDSSFKLIDWRQDFGGEITHGDMYYDLAKLRHNIIFNHDNINDDLFTLETNNNKVMLDLKCNYFLIQQIEEYDRFIVEKQLDLKKIKLLTALIWLNMAPLHEYNVSKFLFYFGKYNLALVMQDYTRP